MMRARMPETGVQLFVVFLVGLVAGFLLVLSGHPAIAGIVLLVAALSVVAMLIVPSPRALDARATRERGDEEEGPLEEEETEGEEERPAGPTLAVQGAAATASSRRRTPAPPPEPPPMEDIVIDLGEEPPAPEVGDDDVWVE